MTGEKRINRRRFLIGTGAVGLGIATLGGASVLAMREPTIKFNELSCAQEMRVQGKVLVAYCSQFGSTGEVAGEIASMLCERGLATDVRRLSQVDDLSPYRAIVVGSPLHSSEWMPEAVDFVGANQNALSKMPVAYFLTCMTLAATDQPSAVQKIAGVLGAVEEQFPTVKPVGHGLFAGAMDLSKMSLLYRMIYTATTPDRTTGDFRDWTAIRAWASTVARNFEEQGV